MLEKTGSIRALKQLRLSGGRSVLAPGKVAVLNPEALEVAPGLMYLWTGEGREDHAQAMRDTGDMYAWLLSSDKLTADRVGQAEIAQAFAKIIRLGELEKGSEVTLHVADAAEEVGSKGAQSFKVLVK